ncbi:UTP--glucose-1-phosphate uridylyltransferase [Candidatus Parcubacteria bacterium]|nr:UTP--glucose-1-phosphate uridylyltransferase [Candidatus Parcubacteria bacterium]
MIKKVIIPAAGLGTRFLPLTKTTAKENLPLVDRPLLSYVVKEAKLSGIEDIVFVVNREKIKLLDYFKPSLTLEKVLTERNQKEQLELLSNEQSFYEGLSFQTCLQNIPKGDGDAVLKAKKLIGKEDFAVAFPDDIFYGEAPALEQLLKVFETSQKPVIGLKKVDKDKLSSYGVVKVEKIANKLYQIKEIVEKPEKGQEPSDLAICGRYVFSNEFLGYLQKSKPTKKCEVILANGIKEMLNDGKMIYGAEIEGQWLECGKTLDWLKSNLFLCLQHKEYGPILKKYLKTL